MKHVQPVTFIGGKHGWGHVDPDKVRKEREMLGLDPTGTDVPDLDDDLLVVVDPEDNLPGSPGGGPAQTTTQDTDKKLPPS